MKIAFLFPGQGSQKPGMGKDLYESYPAARRTFEDIDNVLGFPLSKTIFEGTEEELKQTSITQVAMLAVELAVLAVVREKNISPCVVAGHSLGEYSALVAAGALGISDAVALVQKRARFMGDAGTEKPSGMLALLGLKEVDAANVCRQAGTSGIVDIANFNCPGQIVISGEKAALEKAETIAKEAGAKKCIPLTVSAAFHSRLMNEASSRLAGEIEKVGINAPEVPFIANFSADYIEDPQQIRHSLIRQVNNPVRWMQTMQKIFDAGPDAVLELGPGKVLSGLWRRFDRTKKLFNIEDKATMEEAAAQLADQ